MHRTPPNPADLEAQIRTYNQVQELQRQRLKAIFMLLVKFRGGRVRFSDGSEWAKNAPLAAAEKKVLTIDDLHYELDA